MKRLSFAVILVIAAACSQKTVTCPRLEPTYLPRGMRATGAPALISAQWSRTWHSGSRSVQLDGGVNANLGDDVKRASIRGGNGTYGATGIDAAPLAVQWSEGSCSYAVLVKGVPAEEMLRIANGLRTA